MAGDETKRPWASQRGVHFFSRHVFSRACRLVVLVAIDRVITPKLSIIRIDTFQLTLALVEEWTEIWSRKHFLSVLMLLFPLFLFFNFDQGFSFLFMKALALLFQFLCCYTSWAFKKKLCLSMVFHFPPLSPSRKYKRGGSSRFRLYDKVQVSEKIELCSLFAHFGGPMETPDGFQCPQVLQSRYPDTPQPQHSICWFTNCFLLYYD